MISLEKKPRIQREATVQHLLTEEETMVQTATAQSAPQFMAFSVEVQSAAPLATETEAEKALKERLKTVEKEANTTFKAFAWAVTIILYLLYALVCVLGKWVLPDLNVLFTILQCVFGCVGFAALGSTLHSTLMW